MSGGVVWSQLDVVHTRMCCTYWACMNWSWKLHIILGLFKASNSVKWNGRFVGTIACILLKPCLVPNWHTCYYHGILFLFFHPASHDITPCLIITFTQQGHRRELYLDEFIMHNYHNSTSSLLRLTQNSVFPNKRSHNSCLNKLVIVLIPRELRYKTFCCLHLSNCHLLWYLSTFSRDHLATAGANASREPDFNKHWASSLCCITSVRSVHDEG